MNDKIIKINRSSNILLISLVLIMNVYATLPSKWEPVCATFTGNRREGTCPIPARLSARMTVDSGRYIHIFGGSGGQVPKNDMWTYDSVMGTWTMDSPDWREEYTSWINPVCSDTNRNDANVIPKPRYNSVLTLDTGGLFIIGGGMCSDYTLNKWNTSVFLKDFWMFGRDFHQWIPLVATFDSDPSITSNFSSVIYEHKVYIFGGINGTDPTHSSFLNTLWIADLNPATNFVQDEVVLGVRPQASTVRRVVPNPNSPLPPPRADHTAVVAGTRMYIFGGRNKTHALGDMWAYDFDSGNWTQIVYDESHDPPPPRYAHGSAVCRGAAADMSDVIIIHGGRGLTDLCDETVFGYSIGQRIWFSLVADGFIPSKRVYESLACGIDGEIWLFGGVDEKNRVVNDFYRMY